MLAVANISQRIAGMSPAAAGWIAAGIAAATISGAWIFELFGYPPCELCLQQRWAYYLGVPLAVAAAVAASRGMRASGWLLAAVAVVFAAGSVFGAWHAGVEWGFWQGPAGCTGDASQRAADMNDFLRQIEGTKLVRCDVVALRIFGLSLAGWNAVISAGISALAAIGARNALRGGTFGV